MFNLQHHRGRRLYIAETLRLLIHRASHHHLDDVVFRGIPGYERTHIFPVPHDRYPVSNLVNLIHAVGNVYNSDILGPQITYDFEQLADF